MISFFVQLSIKLWMKISHEEISLIKIKPDQDIDVWHDTLTWNHGEWVSGEIDAREWTHCRNERVVGSGRVVRTKGEHFTKWPALLIGSICSLLKLKILVFFLLSFQVLFFHPIALCIGMKFSECNLRVGCVTTEWPSGSNFFFFFPTSSFKVGSSVLQVVWSGYLEPVISL